MKTRKRLSHLTKSRFAFTAFSIKGSKYRNPKYVGHYTVSPTTASKVLKLMEKECAKRK